MTTATIIVPAYNCADVLSGCLSALSEQTVRPLEIIVVDDGSSDETAAVAESFEGVHLVRRPKRGGAGAARVSGVKEARADIIAFIDSDCMAPPDWLEKILGEFDRDPELVAVGGMYRHCHAKSVISMFGKFEEEYLHGFFAKTPYQSTLTGGNKAVKRSIWEEVRSGRELIHFPNVASSEDTVVANEIRAVGKTLFNPDIFVSHMPRHDFKGFFRRNTTRARTRMLGNMHGLFGPSGDNVFGGFGGLGLFWSAVALWLAALLGIVQVVVPSLWPGLAVAVVVLLAAHFGLSADYFKFINSNHERPCPIKVGFVQRIGLRLLIAGRAACWVVGSLIGIGQYIRDRTRFYWNVAASILHFWRPGRVSKMFYFVTSKCNARCEFCFNLDNIKNWKVRQKDELKLDEVKQLTSNLGRMPYITFSGGEPFARTDLAEVAKAFYDNSKTRWITVPTNGALTNRVVDGVMDILTTCPDVFLTIQFSIDSLHEAHDKSRKIKGGFQAMLDTAKRLSRLRVYYSNLRIQINTPYDTFNLDDLEGIRQFCKDNIDFDQQLFYMFRTDGTLISDDNAHLADGFVDFIQAHDAEEWHVRGRDLWGRVVRVLQGITYTDTRLIKKEKKFIRPCHAVQKFVTLYDDGTFTPCEVLASTGLGNIRDYGYDFYRMKRELDLDKFHKEQILDTKCNCEWMCAPPINMLYDPSTWFRIAKGLVRPGRGPDRGTVVEQSRQTSGTG
ncbi:MAG: glycosyltransferase [Rhodospirillales bacterium]|nr:glycosyltransferase [Rhodospirillales bacterium]